ncbi:ATP-dependent exoDNAse (exonuclease V), alpha subunit, helicase superfamily I [Streptomyces sp. cf386]|uniref:helix-hairpin-helix domain-containing protein n=1 Tax=Streptomyces sp. cf386 TaxID=1761904 RepID=UPI00088FE752|nr:helix-hairpin-helix domain-containing protein [Streptomyces sp. cf386]SDP50037.1 ATP-dependent exoDNAse (exonuclease V), alpha subunit, helicase superfamily I [Streptomyces sp. cf386]
MSTEPPETTEETEPGTPGATPEGGAPGDGGALAAEGETESRDAEGGDGKTASPSEAEAELAAQRIERERIARRKAEKDGPISSGGKLSGKAADLLAAVRAVESGTKPAATVFSEPGQPRRPAPEPVSRPQPVVTADAPAAPAPETVESVRRVLSEGGAPEALAPQVAAALGEGAEDQLRADPWQLLRVGGVRPEQADGFARALLGAECGPDDERRGRAVTVWLLEQAALAGHTALEMPTLTAALVQRGVPDADTAVQHTLAEGEALAFQDALDEPGTPLRRDDDEGEDEERPVRVLVGLERYALAEESLADGLARLINSAPKQDGSAEEWERAATAAGSAVDLIRAVSAHGLVLHTGGEASLAEPAALLHTARTLGLRAWAATHSPLGRARFSALLSEGDQPEVPGVVTVAGLLSGTEGPGRDVEGALDLDLLVVLDAPQLDVETAALLTESLPDGARLVLAGDPAVLWSAGPGRVFADLLAARICPQLASRRPDPGPLGELVSGVGIGELNQVEAPGKEVVIVPVRDAGEAVHRTVQLVADSVPRAIGVPTEQTQVITPGHGGAAGTRALNAALKERLNPGLGRFGGFDPGDRVAYSPAPGRTVPGQVVTADAEGLHLSCAGETVVVPKERVDQSVRHGWALTAHQAVGARWPAVVVVLPGDAAQTLTRPWVYTAFSRADRHLSVVHGAEQALPRAVTEIPAKTRTTRLPVLLKPQVPSAD